MALMQVTPDQIMGALSRARAGDTVEFEGEWRPTSKIIGLHGAEGKPITLRGSSIERAHVIWPGGSFVSCLRFEDSDYFDFGRATVRDGTGREVRGVQAFRCQRFRWFDLKTQNLACDALHTTGSSHGLIERCFVDGAGNRPMSGGKGPHAVYFSGDIDDCDDLIARDIDCTNVLGAAFQGNGDGQRLTNVQFLRCRALDWKDGFGINLPECENVTLEDIILRSRFNEVNGGVSSNTGTTGVTIARYDITARPVFDGSVAVLAQGTPAVPLPPTNNGDGPAPEPPVPPTEDWRARALAAEAKNAAWQAWYDRAPRQA